MGRQRLPGLLAASEPDAVEIVNPEGRSPYLLTCEHAGQRVPHRLAGLGLSKQHLGRHIAWDIGAERTARHLASRLDATLIIQRYSRLVIDCNRPLSAADAVPGQSDGTVVPGNQDISVADRDARIQEIYLPFQDAITGVLDRRLASGNYPVLIALHTFTPQLAVNPAPRPWDLGLLYHRDNRLAVLLDQALDSLQHDRNVIHNEPYSVCDKSDHTIPFHGEKRNLKHVLLEIRNDHVSAEAGQIHWGNFLGDVFDNVEPMLA